MIPLAVRSTRRLDARSPVDLRRAGTWPAPQWSSTMILRWLGAALVVLVAGLIGQACQEDDLGIPCAVDRLPLDDGQTDWIVGEEPKVVEDQILQDGACESFVCLVQSGIPPYCSRPCNRKLPCPDGFVCETIQTLGPRAEDSFCLYAACETASDCKDIKTYDCVTFPSITLDPTATFKRCQLKPPEE